MPTPKFDRNQPHGEVYSSAGSADGAAATRYIQSGHRFAANGDYIGPEDGSKNTAAPAVVEPEDNPALLISLTEAEVEQLLRVEGAEALLDLGLDELARAVAGRGGPTFSGANAHRLYAAWLIKADEPDLIPATVAPIDPTLSGASLQAAIAAAQAPVLPEGDDPDQRRPADGKPEVV